MENEFVFSAADDNPFVVDGAPQWSEAVDYLRERALSPLEAERRDRLCAIADLIESFAGDGGCPELVSVGTHPLSR